LSSLQLISVSLLYCNTRCACSSQHWAAVWCLCVCVSVCPIALQFASTPWQV